MTHPRRGLGRGLDALFGNPPAAPAPSPQPAPEAPASPPEDDIPDREGSRATPPAPAAPASSAAATTDPSRSQPAPSNPGPASGAPPPSTVAAGGQPVRPAPAPSPVDPPSAGSGAPVSASQPGAAAAPSVRPASLASPNPQAPSPAPAYQQSPAAAPPAAPAVQDSASAAYEVPVAPPRESSNTAADFPSRYAPAPPVPPAASATPVAAPRSEAPPVAPPPAVAATAAPPLGSARRGYPEQLDIDAILPNPEQPRAHFEPEKLRELADSIREHGILQPLVVTRDDRGSIVLIAGERRLQAARLAGLDTVPVVFRDTGEDELLELALIENIQRADLNPIEEALAYRRLIDDYGLTQEDAARRVGKSRAAVANAMRLLHLEQEIRGSLIAGEISEGHARALLGLTESRSRIAAWREVVKRRLSVRDTEAHVRRALAGPLAPDAGGAQASPSAAARRDAQVADIETRLRRALSTRVTVTPVRDGARIIIECYSSEEFGNVVGQLLGEDE